MVIFDDVRIFLVVDADVPAADVPAADRLGGLTAAASLGGLAATTAADTLCFRKPNEDNVAFKSQ